MTSETDSVLLKLSQKFPAGDIKWRVMRPERWGSKILCFVYPYLTARAIHQRLDDVVGPGGWCNTPQQVIQVGQTKEGKPVLAVQVGLSIRIGGEWVTKYNVSEPTAIEPAKGGFSGAEKRAAEEWGIGRYLWLLGQMEAETVQERPPKKADWTHAYLNKDRSGDYWWRPPQLPSWALPNDIGTDPPVTDQHVTALKKQWAQKFAPKEKNLVSLREGFAQLVTSVVGKCPVDYSDGWTQEMIRQVRAKIEASSPGGAGPSPDVPFQ